MTDTARHRLTVIPVPGHGAEDVLVGEDGWVLTGTDDGSVFRVRPDGGRVERVGSTGGRPLGLEHLPDGRLLVCDAERGLLAMDPTTGRCEVLTDVVEGRRLVFCNNAAVADDGTIWFSDSSLVHPITRWRAELVENTATGRLLRRDLDGRVEVVLSGLRFANGVALAADGSFVAVAQSAGRSVVRHWLTGPSAGTTEPLATDLPGYPDNIARGSDGLVWVTLASPADPLLERLMRGPFALRRVAGRLPRALQPQVARTARAVALDDTGEVVRDVAADGAAYHMVTGVREHDGTLWLGSLEEDGIARIDLAGGADRVD